jgi:hypothetical protein
MTKTKQLVTEITIEAIRATQQRKAFVFVDYHANINGLTVWAEPIDTDFNDLEREFNFLIGHYSDSIYLEWPAAELKLEAVLAKIKEL